MLRTIKMSNQFMKGIKYVMFQIILLSFCFSNGYAQEHHVTNDEMHKKIEQEAANPVSHDISLVPFQTNFNFNTGDFNRTQTEFIFDPTIPFSLSKDVYLVVRTIIPLILQPDNAISGSSFGVGNTFINAFFCPPNIGKIFYGIGPSFILPTASAPQFGGDAFGVGPALTTMYLSKHWIFGLISTMVWSYKTPDLKLFATQYFVTHLMKKGWFINSTPAIEANFNQDAKQQWTVPVGGGGGKIVHFKHIPIKFQVQAYYNVVKPDGGADYAIHATAALIFHKLCK